MTFAEKLQALRKEHGLSQEDLADKLNVSRQAVSKWEAGQAYPETEKLIVLSGLFNVSLDSFMKSLPAERSGESAEQKSKSRKYKAAALAASLALLLSLTANAWFYFQGQNALQGGSAGLTMPESENSLTASENSSAPGNEPESGGNSIPGEESSAGGEEDNLSAPLNESTGGTARLLPTQARLQQYFFDFARRYRLDYAPYFEQGKPPSESPEYLYYAFALNLDNWGEDKGKMSKRYVEEIALSYFGVGSLSHLPMRKGWDLEGDTYTAVAGSISFPPLCRLQSLEVSFQDGLAVYEIVLAFYAKSDGSIEDEADIQAFCNEPGAPDENTWRLKGSEKFVFYGGYDTPVFLAHEALS